jgi:hypothetical protein
MSGMKLLTEYLERAVSLERLAADEQDSKFKDDLMRGCCVSKAGGKVRQRLWAARAKQA